MALAMAGAVETRPLSPILFGSDGIFMVLSLYFSLLSLFYVKEFGSIIVKNISETFLIQSRDLDSLHLD